LIMIFFTLSPRSVNIDPKKFVRVSQVISFGVIVTY
jgi:hypothetical protein